MKEYWDQMHPELSHFNEKQIRQQATRFEKKLTTFHDPEPTEPTENNEINGDAHLDVIPPDQQVNVNENVLEISEGINEEFINAEIEEETINIVLHEQLGEKFLLHYNVFKNRTLSQRNYKTQVVYNITAEEWTTINRIISTFMDDNADTIDLWQLNVIQYCGIVTLLDHKGVLKERKHFACESKKPAWRSVMEERINNIRRKISFIMVIVNGRRDSTEFTPHQLTIKAKLKRWYGNTKQTTLLSKVAQLRHELKVLSESLRHRTRLAERDSINKNFTKNQKQIFRSWKGKEITVNECPTQDEITTFWSGIWATPKHYKQDAPWITTLERSYCKDVTSKKYVINSEVFNKILRNMKNDGAPGNDLVRCYWIKKLSATHDTLVRIFKTTYDQGETLPEWLVTGRTILLPKNEQTKNAKNYRPIACQNITYKLYTGILNSFLVDHCTSNNIITLEQAGGKPGSWGCTDQLLINKMILDEVKKNRRNLHLMWFDYKKAFDSVPHDWIIKALELAKVPYEIIRSVQNLMSIWATKLYLSDITSEVIKYLCGILQGDCLSLILFILSVNPLSFLLKKLPGYNAGPPGQRDTKITHLFFVDNLKTYAQDAIGAKLQLDLISKFTKDIGMEFGQDKCAHVYVNKGKKESLGEKFSIPEMELNELEDGEQYKYLGQDECVGYDNVLNKERVLKEYYRRIRKI